MLCLKRCMLLAALPLASLSASVLFFLLRQGPIRGQFPVRTSGTKRPPVLLAGVDALPPSLTPVRVSWPKQPFTWLPGVEPQSPSSTRPLPAEATWPMQSPPRVVDRSTSPRPSAPRPLAWTWSTKQAPVPLSQKPSLPMGKPEGPKQWCGLPAAGRWATVKIPGIAPFPLAVYDHHDIVSDRVKYLHNWENLDPTVYGRPGHAIDVGGNIGTYSLALAKAGWNVTTFEPMLGNLELIRASLCANPEAAARIDLHEAGLSDVAETCRMVSDRYNAGDGAVMCRGEDVRRQPGHDFIVRGSFQMKVLDEEYPKLKFAAQKVDFVKVDVEGFECHVWRGARELLKQRPRLIQSEVWGTMQNCTPTEYLKLFRDAGYQLKRDPRCQINAPWAGPRKKAAIEDYFMCGPQTAS